MLAPRTLSARLNELKLISLYEQRHNRTLQAAIKQLEDMQAKRKERERLEMCQASRIAKLFQMKGEAYDPAVDGFVFSTKVFEKFETREAHLREASIAESVRYNVHKFAAEVARR